MTILITGGAGYIGSHVALNLIDAGYKVTIIDDLSTGNKNLIPNNAEFIKCNINELEKIDSLLKKKKFSAIAVATIIVPNIAIKEDLVTNYLSTNK